MIPRTAQRLPDVPSLSLVLDSGTLFQRTFTAQSQCWPSHFTKTLSGCSSVIHCSPVLSLPGLVRCLDTCTSSA